MLGHTDIDVSASKLSKSVPPSAYTYDFFEKGRKDWSAKFPRRAPSEKGKPKSFATDQRKSPPAFYFNRPPATAATIPITLYNAIFAQFQDDCETYAPTKEDHDFALKFSTSMSGFYDEEKGRAKEARKLFGEYGLDFLDAGIDGYHTDGDLRLKEFCVSILEVKPELVLGTADPLFQGGWYYVAFTRPQLQANLTSHLPCFLIYLCGKVLINVNVASLKVLITGAHIGFAGAVWTDRPHLQVLAPMLPLCYHTTDVGMRMRTARYLGATKKAIFALMNYYKIELPHISALPRLDPPIVAFPHPSHFTALEDGTTRRAFKYSFQPDVDKLIFYGTAGEDRIFIKFVRRYSKEAHLKCASLGFAPALRGFDLIPGGWSMVVMDFVGDRYHGLDESDAKGSFESEIREKVTQLHQEGFVHGDIRTTNVLVDKGGSPGMILVDFDWAGVIGETRYPMNVNNETIKRPYGAHDNEFILAQHDMTMIDFMFQ